MSSPDVTRAPAGTRNATLNRAAFRLGQLAVAGLGHPHQLADERTGSLEAEVHPDVSEADAQQQRRGRMLEDPARRATWVTRVVARACRVSTSAVSRRRTSLAYGIGVRLWSRVAALRDVASDQ